MKERVLVTGGAGYIGSSLVRILLTNGYKVRVLDNLTFGGESLIEFWLHPDFEFIKGDLRNISTVRESLQNVDHVCHLAAIVGEPPCNKYPQETQEINWAASVQLYECCEEAKIQRFVFASTCSNYGKMQDPTAYLDEDSPLNPISLYAETKVKFEEYLLSIKSETITRTILRFSTVYGVSPRIRFDLTVNEFTRDAASGIDLLIYGEHFWRPYCHVYDLANAMYTVLISPKEVIANNYYNVGDTRENYTKKMLMDEISKQIPSLQVTYKSMGSDPRDYRVNADKIKNQLGFQITRTVPQGIAEVKHLITSRVLSDPFARKYTNI